MPVNARSASPWAWTFAALAALACGLPALGLAWHYPLSSALMLLAATGLAALAWHRLDLALACVLAGLPAIGLMPWSGWLSFEELDIAVLAVAAGAYARIAWDHKAAGRSRLPRPARQAAMPLKWLVLLAFAASTLISMWRGFGDAGGFAWGWWQGYHEPMNSLRVAKSFLLALCLLPPWLRFQVRAPVRASQALGWGFAGGLALVSMIMLWERAANTGLANFSTDYRATALFWEMHVGGAALDAFLALTLPFALRELWQPGSARRWALAGTFLFAGIYASLVTFSRGVYLAVPVALAVTVVLHGLQRSTSQGIAPWRQLGVGVMWALLALAAFVALAQAVFMSSGYRGVLALLGALALVLPAANWLRAMPRRGWVVGAAVCFVAAVPLWMLSQLHAKGAYLAYALVWFVGAGLLLVLKLRAPPPRALWPGALVLGTLLTLFGALPMVAVNWGYDRALLPALAAAGALLTLMLWGGIGSNPRWPESWRWQGQVWVAMAAASVLIGVLFGGAYMGERFTGVDRDLGGRMLHWQRALSWLVSPMENAFGKGAGRYPASHFLSGVSQDQTGDYRLRQDGDASYVALTGGKHSLDWGEFLRLSQRVSAFEGTLQIHADVRAEADVGLHFEVCRKQLLYDKGCMVAGANVKAKPGQWQPLSLTMRGKGLSRGDWFAPHLIAFSMAVTHNARKVEIDNVRLKDAAGRDLLANGDFSRGMSRWFFSSDRHHMPWHIKSMPLNVLFDQGWIGLGLWTILLGAALWRVTGGHARRHTLAPAAAGGLIGLAVVGLFDSVLDAPRVAFAFYWLVMLALTLPAASPGSPARSASAT